MLDKAKIWVAIAVLIGGVVAYYQLPKIMGPDVSILIRVAAIAIAVVAALVIAMMSSYGRGAVEFSKGSKTELKKMIWPTRAETIQGTTMVIILVIIFSLFLWAVDAFSFNAIYDWILGVDGN
ncbi:MAG: preprotein translocase subunit SecE [Arenicella sp.]